MKAGYEAFCLMPTFLVQHYICPQPQYTRLSDSSHSFQFSSHLTSNLASHLINCPSPTDLMTANVSQSHMRVYKIHDIFEPNERRDNVLETSRTNIKFAQKKIKKL